MKATLISDRVSYLRENHVLRIIVLGAIPRWKEALLTTWLVAWLLVGVAMGYVWTDTDDRDLKLAVVVFGVFWAYYLWRVGRTWLYRRGGNELIEVKGDTLNLKRSFFTFGKTHSYFIDNIRNFEIIEVSPRSWAHHYEKGWWVLGGQRLSFEYFGRRVVFGMQLNEREANEVFNLVRRAMRDATRNR